MIKQCILSNGEDEWKSYCSEIMLKLVIISFRTKGIIMKILPLNDCIIKNVRGLFNYENI